MTYIFFFLFIPILALILLCVNFFFAPDKPYKEKETPFECGYHSFLQTRAEFTVLHFFTAITFLVLSIEIIVLFPYATSVYINQGYGMAVMALFVIILTAGFAFELGKGALQIDTKESNDKVILNSTIALFKHDTINNCRQSQLLRGFHSSCSCLTPRPIIALLNYTVSAEEMVEDRPFIDDIHEQLANAVVNAVETNMKWADFQSLVAELKSYVNNAIIHPEYKKYYMARDEEFIYDTRAQFMSERMERTDTESEKISVDKGENLVSESQNQSLVETTGSQNTHAESIFSSFKTSIAGLKRGSDSAELTAALKPKRLMSSHRSQAEPNLRKLLANKSYKAQINSSNTSNSVNTDSDLMQGVNDLSEKNSFETTSQPGFTDNSLLEPSQDLNSQPFSDSDIYDDPSDEESNSGGGGNDSGSGPESSSGGYNGGSGGNDSGYNSPESSSDNMDTNSSNYVLDPHLPSEDILPNYCSDTKAVYDIPIYMHWEYIGDTLTDIILKYDLWALWI